MLRFTSINVNCSVHFIRALHWVRPFYPFQHPRRKLTRTLSLVVPRPLQSNLSTEHLGLHIRSFGRARRSSAGCRFDRLTISLTLLHLTNWIANLSKNIKGSSKSPLAARIQPRSYRSCPSLTTAKNNIGSLSASS